MKKFLLMALALGLSCTVFGIAISGIRSKPLVRNGQEEEAARIIQAVKTASEARSASRDLPIARCANAQHHFGRMEPLSVGSHTFQIENVGKQPLIIRGGQSSCKCTLSDLKEAIVESGQSHPVTLTWNSGHAAQEFGQSAIVHTNDPLNPEIQLSIQGEVKAIVAASTDTIDLGRLTPSTPITKQFVLYSQLWGGFDVERIESTNPHITAEIDTQAYKESFAVDDEINHATSRIVVKVDYDGQAPHGPLAGLLRLHVRPPADWAKEQTATVEQIVEHAEILAASNMGEAELPDLRYPVESDGSVLAEIGFHGQVIRRLSLYGKSVTSRGTVDLGKVRTRESQGTQWIIVGRIRGDQRAESISASVTGIPGLTAEVQNIASKDGSQQSFRILLQLTEEIKPAIYDRGQAGKLVVAAPGIPGNEELEMPVSLTVLPTSR